MKRREELHRRRKMILRELASIDSLRRGSVNVQWFPVIRDGKKTPERRGPYYIWTRKAQGKTVSKRLTSQNELARARLDAENYTRFKTLCRELEGVIMELGELEREAAAEQEALKKGLKSRSSRAGKSRG